MSKADIAVELHNQYNCTQAVLSAYAADYGLDKEKALQLAVGFGAGMGRHQGVCGAISGAIMVLGLASQFREEDSRPKINEVYAKVYDYMNKFRAKYGTLACFDLLDSCNLSTEAGQKRFREENMREKCWEYDRFCCDLLDELLNVTRD